MRCGCCPSTALIYKMHLESIELVCRVPTPEQGRDFVPRLVSGEWLSTVAGMDRLVVLDRGRIVEQGSHRDLLASGGAYAKLWQHQSRLVRCGQRPILRLPRMASPGRSCSICVVSLSSVNEQVVDVPVQPPLHPMKVNPLLGVSVRVVLKFAPYVWVQVLPGLVAAVQLLI